MKALHSTVILLVLASVSSAGVWHTEFVDTDSSVNSNTTIALDSGDRPRILYFDDDDDALKYASWDNYMWNIETIISGKLRYSNNSLALDQEGNPHIIFADDNSIIYAYLVDASWHFETIGSEYGMGADLSLALDSDDKPYASYYNYRLCDLKLIYWDGYQWRIETVDSEGDVGMELSLELDGYDRPHISYYDFDNKDLKYAYFNGSEWCIETVDAEGQVGPYSSIAIDSQDRPHISYRYSDGSTTDLKYARWDGVQWRIETADAEGDAGGYTSIALDTLDRPYISNLAYDISRLKCAHWNGVEWQTDIVDTNYGCGKYSSIAVDSLNQPHISYLYEIQNDLKYAWYEIFFLLLSPERGEVVTTLTPTLDWSDDDNPDLTGYTLWWGTDPDFNSYNEVTGLHESKYTIPSGIEDGDTIYWRVKSIDGEDEEYWAEEMDWYFNVDLDYDPVYHLMSPEKGEVVYAFPFTFDWEDQQIPNLESYTLWWGTDPDFITYNEITDIDESEYTISGGIEDGARVYWRVKSLDDGGGEYWAEELDWYFDIDLGGGVDLADFGAGATDEGVLVNWRLSGEEPAGLRVLRGAGEPEMISGNLPGDSSRYLDRGVEPGGSYAYWLEVIDAEGVVSRFGPTEAVSVPGETFTLVLYAAYPSPSRDAVNFVYSLPDDGRVVLSVYDLSGRRIATPVDSELTAGRHEVSWSCGDMPSGVYLYRLETSAGSLTQRLVVSR